MNRVTLPDRYTITHAHDPISLLSVYMAFIRRDLARAFNRTTVKETNTAKTAVVTNFRLFGFVRRHFGLSNATQTIQRFQSEV